jgi:hypothetical protein
MCYVIRAVLYLVFWYSGRYCCVFVCVGLQASDEVAKRLTVRVASALTKCDRLAESVASRHDELVSEYVSK